MRAARTAPGMYANQSWMRKRKFESDWVHWARPVSFQTSLGFAQQGIHLSGVITGCNRWVPGYLVTYAPQILLWNSDIPAIHCSRLEPLPPFPDPPSPHVRGLSVIKVLDIDLSNERISIRFLAKTHLNYSAGLYSTFTPLAESKRTQICKSKIT